MALYPSSFNLRCSISMTGKHNSPPSGTFCPEVPELCLNKVTYLLHSHSQIAECCEWLLAVAGQSDATSCMAFRYSLAVNGPYHAANTSLFPTWEKPLKNSSLLRISSPLLLLSVRQWTYSKLHREIWMFLVYPLSIFYSGIFITISELTSAHIFLLLVS